MLSVSRVPGRDRGSAHADLSAEPRRLDPLLAVSTSVALCLSTRRYAPTLLARERNEFKHDPIVDNYEIATHFLVFVFLWFLQKKNL